MSTPFYAGQTLTASDLNARLDPPLAHLRQGVVQSIPNITFTAILFDAEDLDSHNGHSTSTNTSRYTCMRAGVYELMGGVAFAPNATGRRLTTWRRNGTNIQGARVDLQAIAGGFTSIVPARTTQVRMALGDYVELTCYQDSGGALNTTVTGDEQSTMTVKYVGP